MKLSIRPRNGEGWPMSYPFISWGDMSHTVHSRCKCFDFNFKASRSWTLNQSLVKKGKCWGRGYFDSYSHWWQPRQWA